MIRVSETEFKEKTEKFIVDGSFVENIIVIKEKTHNYKFTDRINRLYEEFEDFKILYYYNEASFDGYHFGVIIEVKKLKDDFKDNLKVETNELADKVNNLHEFMKTKEFYELDRVNKDLLYEQHKHMMAYLQVLGKRCEVLEIKLNTGEENK